MQALQLLFVVGAVFSAGISTAEESAPDPKELFGRLDKNQDGDLTRDEIPQEQLRFFERLLRNADKNDDGKLSSDEFLAGHKTDGGPGLPINNLGGQGGRGQGDVKQRFERLDRNKDGKITRDEVPDFAKERLIPLFDRLKKDALSLEDLSRMGQPGDRRPDGEMPRGPVFARLLDTNRDGRISKAEWAKAGELFAELDQNDDGELDMRELMGPPLDGEQMAEGMAARERMERPNGAGNGGIGREFFDRMDRDKDGKISKDEAGPRLKERFDQVDKNSDGYLTPDELRNAAPGGRSETPDGKARPKRPSAE